MQGWSLIWSFPSEIITDCEDASSNVHLPRTQVSDINTLSKKLRRRFQTVRKQLLKSFKKIFGFVPKKYKRKIRKLNKLNLRAVIRNNELSMTIPTQSQ